MLGLESWKPLGLARKVNLVMVRPHVQDAHNLLGLAIPIVDVLGVDSTRVHDCCYGLITACPLRVLREKVPHCNRKGRSFSCHAMGAGVSTIVTKSSALVRETHQSTLQP
jgi:hypothetical protein